MEKRTDLAVEARESFPKDHVEVEGVVLEKRWNQDHTILTTFVHIKDEKGSRAMKKPRGLYITVESEDIEEGADIDKLCEKIKDCVELLCPGIQKKNVLVAGLGNQEVTSDSLGPKVVGKIFATRHIKKEFGCGFMKENRWGTVSAISPGVMAQTGMEAAEVLKGIVKELKPEALIVLDALAARSLTRLCKTVQLTNTGISPGSGVGNHRMELSEKKLGIPVVAIGVPTVVDAETIISDHLEHVLSKQGYSENETKCFLAEVLDSALVEDVFVTPKNIDESINHISDILSGVVNLLMHGSAK